jgi:predicted PurR-regulated permease PerM
MNAENSTSMRSRLIGLAAVIIIIAGIRLSRPLLMPLALAALISLLLAPLANAFERLRVGRTVAAMLVAFIGVLFLGGVVSLTAYQVMSLAESLPSYEDNIIKKINSFRQVSKGEVGEAASSLKKIKEEITSSQPASQPASQETGQSAESDSRLYDVAPLPSQYSMERLQANGSDTDNEKNTSLAEIDASNPLPVRVVRMPSDPWALVKRYFGALAEPLSTGAVVAVLIVFLLLGRQDLRQRIIQLIGNGGEQEALETVDEIVHRISRYLFAQLAINVIYAIPVGIILYTIGLPNALLWATLAVLLRFLPYLGPWLAAMLPILLSLAVFDGWTRPLSIVAMYVTFELISNNVLEPYLYGRSTGITSFGVIVAAFFWTWLWGALGLLLAMPITVSLVVIGKHFPSLAFLNTLFAQTSSESE